MANRTDPAAATVHGTNPQNLIEKIVRTKIYECTYWKAHCFALNAETLIDRAVQLRSIGGTYGGTRKPTDFICLVLKMLQIQPDKEIIIEFILNEDYKYLRILGAFYWRLTAKGPDVYRYLEPLYNDYRKVRMMTAEGHYVLTHVDELVDQMLLNDHMFDTALPFIPSRMLLEKTAGLAPRISILDDDFDEELLEAEARDAEARAEALQADLAATAERDRGRERSPRRARSGSRERRRSRSRERGRDRDREREKERDRGDRGDRGDKERGRDRDRDRDRGHKDKDRERDRDREGRSERKRRERSASPGQGKGKEHKRRVPDANDPEIQAINAERAKLGLRPLK